MTKRILNLLVVIFLFSIQAAHADSLSLGESVKRAYDHNPRLAAQRSRIEQERSLVSSHYALPDPMVGVSELKRGNSTTYATISQKIEFPTKYFLRAKAQDHIADSHEAKLRAVELQIRSEVISTYYGIYAVQKIKQLTKRDLQRLEKLSRTAETKYAAGQASNHDSMKAHVAHTEVEATLLMLSQEEEALQARMAALLNKEREFRIDIIEEGLLAPNITEQLKQLDLAAVSGAPLVKVKGNLAQAARAKSAAIDWEYAPDFQVRYQKRIGGAPADSHIIGVEMSIPLWFWGSASRSSAYSSQAKEAEHKLSNTKQEVTSRLRILKSRILTGYDILSIYKTSLIPQALSTYNSSSAAYRASKINFLEYLDAERSLLKVEVAQHRTLTRYIESLTQFEAILGRVISDLGTTKEKGVIRHEN